MNSQTRISEFADRLTEYVVRQARIHIDSDKLTPDEVRQVELTVASQLQTGKRSEYGRVRFSPPHYAVDTNDAEEDRDDEQHREGYECAPGCEACAEETTIDAYDAAKRDGHTPRGLIGQFVVIDDRQRMGYFRILELNAEGVLIYRETIQGLNRACAQMLELEHEAAK